MTLAVWGSTTASAAAAAAADAVATVAVVVWCTHVFRLERLRGYPISWGDTHTPNNRFAEAGWF